MISQFFEVSNTLLHNIRKSDLLKNTCLEASINGKNYNPYFQFFAPLNLTWPTQNVNGDVDDDDDIAADADGDDGGEDGGDDGGEDAWQSCCCPWQGQNLPVGEERPPSVFWRRNTAAGKYRLGKLKKEIALEHFELKGQNK